MKQTAAVAAAGALVCAAGCGTQAGSTGNVANVVWWNMWSGSTVGTLNQLVAQFNKTHPSIKVTMLNLPSTSGEAKFLSSVAAGDPPDLFTDWEPDIGTYAKDGVIQPLDKFMTGPYANLRNWYYPVVLDGGLYNGNVYGLSNSNSGEELFYNKSMMKAAGISQPPRTLAQLDTDQAKEWKISGGRVVQMGFYPFADAELDTYMSYFGVKDAGFVGGKYDLAEQPAAVSEATWLASYAKYPYSAVQGFETTFGGTIDGSSEDPFAMGKEGFSMDGPWEPFDDMAHDDPAMLKNYGVEQFPTVSGGPTQPNSYVWGNYDVIPKGAQNSRAAFEFAAWLSGFQNADYMDSAWLTPVGILPTSPAEAAAPSFEKWASANPWVRGFITDLASPHSEQMTLTPVEDQYFTAMTNADQYLATSKMSPAQALQYVDQTANAALSKG